MSFLTLTAVLGSEYLQANQGYVDTYWNLLHLDDVWNRGLLNDIIWPKVIFYTGQYNSSGGKPLIGRGGRYFPDSLNFNLQLLPELFINHNQHVVSTSSNSRTYGKYSGLCLETQRFGDSPHHPNFPTWELKPGEVRRCPALLVRCINMIKYMIKKLYHSKIYNFLVWPQAHFSGVRTRHFLPVLHSLSLTKKGIIYWNPKQICHKTWHVVEGVLCTFRIFWIVGASSLVCTLLRQRHQAFPSFASQAVSMSSNYLLRIYFPIQVRSGGARCELHWIHNSALLTIGVGDGHR